MKLFNIQIWLLLLFLSFLQCQTKYNNNEGEKSIKRIVKSFKYDKLTIPLFFDHLIYNHLKDFKSIDSSFVNNLLKENKISILDSSNINKIYSLKILHDLFTSQNASDCSYGEILDIPYMWHWLEPNPRNEIYFVKNKQLLVLSKPPVEFSKYSSFANIDRTPFLFLSDLLAKSPLYFSKSCDTFSTFGWCSEREMAFVALATLLNFEGKVIAEGNHSWSEFLIEFKMINGSEDNFILKIDNTFNSFKISKLNNFEIVEWKKYNGNTNLADWYNEKSKSKSELFKINNFYPDKLAFERVENKVVKYLNSKK